jgi:hypothetical protein
LPTLRRNLYQLKDTLSDLKAAIDGASQYAGSESFLKLMQLTETIDVIRTGLGIYLSNHHSRWLDTMRAGGLPYSEFKALNIASLLICQQSCVSLTQEMKQGVRIQELP